MEAEVLRDVFHIPDSVMEEPFPACAISQPCEFCDRKGEWDVETQVNGEEKSIWICGKCPNSKMILKKWEIIK